VTIIFVMNQSFELGSHSHYVEKFPPGSPCLTLLRPAGGPSLWTPDAVRLCLSSFLSFSEVHGAHEAFLLVFDDDLRRGGRHVYRRLLHRRRRLHRLRILQEVRIRKTGLTNKHQPLC
jgi:hypothetical protein